jgi:hypothetical protein
MSSPIRLLPVLLVLAVVAPANAADAAPTRPTLLHARTARGAGTAARIQYPGSQTLQGSSMSLDGVVYRSGGTSTVWINQKAQTESESSRTGVNVVVAPGKPGSAMLSPGEEEPTQLKVGEAINRATGERNTRLGGGVVVTPASPAAKR